MLVRLNATLFLILLLWAAALTPNSLAAQDRPNVIVILSDDQGWGDLSVTGNSNLATPNIDSLAADGAFFDRFYVAPVCSPTRAAFLTGRYHPRTGVYSTSAGGERLDLDESTIAEAFKEAGYATAAFGKWHNGMQYPYYPLARGFDQFYGFCSGHWGHYFSPVLEQNNRLVRGEGYVTDDFTDHALEFITENQDEPFFCYLPFNTPHSPMQVPDRFYEKFDGKELEQRHRNPDRENVAKTRAALAMCENIDWNVGRILERLEELEIADETIVVYFSDNGPNGWRWNDGMKGRKGSVNEGGVRVPCLVRWPEAIPAGREIPQLAGAIDLLPTLADLAGISVNNEKPLDGISLAPLLTGNPTDRPNRKIFSHWRGRVSVRTPRYRLDHQGRLYDMVADPGQHQNVAAEHPQVTKRLSEAVSDWKENVLSQLDRRGRPFTVGYPEMPMTRLPARDGIAHGEIDRSNRFPNCSFFRNWETTDGRITWDIKVATTGRYRAIVDYACPKENLGAQVELAFQDHSVRTKVTEAFDPPLVGAEHDRIPRQESYVKDFKPLELGILKMQKGRGNLVLRANKIPGEGVIDVRRVRLELLEN